MRALTRHQVATLLPPRPRDSHKGMFGTVLIIGGELGMVGAALLAGRAALKMGAGCVHVGLLAETAPTVDMAQPELMLHPAATLLDLPARTEISARSVFAIGCGLGQSPTAAMLLRQALGTNAPLVLDADALNLVASHPELRALLRQRTAASIITPHPGEAARLLGLNTAQVQTTRSATALRLAEELNCSVVLKGADSLCVTRNGQLWRNTTGNPGMSAPGMGDVLTGMIAAFIAQGLSADDALLLAVHLHGAAGDALKKQGTSLGMTATELIEQTRKLLNQQPNRDQHKD
ncbi:MAG: NAD(P)H-hydrate dehydratase [Nitrosomonadales bacterium]|nr:NAD(P)H-hydrate dehydratase [Nitrosomonadales bacterium]